MKRWCVKNLNKALGEWELLLGCEQFVCYNNKVIQDIGEFSSRKVPAILYPTNLKEVQEVVRIANVYGVPLHTFSIGRNWGNGSRLPVEDAVLVELSRMHKVIEVNQKFQYVVLEPGVTQGQLTTFLNNRNSSLVANIGGAGTSVSVIGNLLDRGSGIYGCKTNECLAMEVVLGSGETIRTGFWNYDNPPSNDMAFYPLGIGPDIRGLFIQSNFGIVTKMAVRLFEKRERTITVIGATSCQLVHLVNVTHELRKLGLLEKGIDISDANAQCDYYQSPDHEDTNKEIKWNVIGALSGPESLSKTICNTIKSKLRHSGLDVRFFNTNILQTDQHLSEFSWMNDWVKRYRGKVDNSHLSLLTDKINDNLDLDNDPHCKGFLCVNVAVPMDGDMVVKIIDISTRIAKSLGLKTYIRGFSDLGVDALKGHFSVIFNRKNQSEIKQAHKWKNMLYLQLRHIGIYPQRLDIDSMQDFTLASQNDYWRTLKKIKNALDPNNILSPGRYLVNDQ